MKLSRRHVIGYLASLPIAERLRPVPKLTKIGVDWGTYNRSAIVVFVSGRYQFITGEVIPIQTLGADFSRLLKGC